MKKQFHLCYKDKDLKAENMNLIRNYTAKPQGGFWTSTYDETQGSDWIQWLLDEGNRYEPNELEGYILTPKKETKPYIVDSFEDSKKLLEEYGFIQDFFQSVYDAATAANGESAGYMFWAIDYEKMKESYDCLHLTRNGFVDCFLKSRPYISLFDGFDCESTVWLNWSFEEEMQYVQLNPKIQENWNLYEILRKQEGR